MAKLSQREIGNTGLRIDTLGFGCAPLGNLYHSVSDIEAAFEVDTAWAEGFCYYDTAPQYGQGLSERRIGDMLRPLKDRDYILSTKVGRLLKPAPYAQKRHGFLSPMPFNIEYDYSYDGIIRSYEDSILCLGLERIDILFMHDLGIDTHGAQNTRHLPIAMSGGLKAVQSLKSQGLIKAIGLGVNESQVCEEAMEYGDWDCFLLAGRYTLLEQGCLATLLSKCEQGNCSIIVGGPYNSGILATGSQGSAFYNYAPAEQNILTRVAKIEAICREFDVTLAAVLQFPLTHPAVVSVTPGLGNSRRIHQTLVLFGELIPNAFWLTLQELGLLDPAAPVPRV